MTAPHATGCPSTDATRNAPLGGTRLAIVGRQAGGRIEPGLEPPVQLLEVLADAPARGRARRIDPFDPEAGQLQQPMDLRHRRHQARALRGRQCLEQGGGGLVRAPVHLPDLPPPRRRQAGLPDALVRGPLAQPHQALPLEGRDQPAHVAGIQPEPLTQVAEIRPGGPDLVQQARLPSGRVPPEEMVVQRPGPLGDEPVEAPDLGRSRR